MLCSASVILHLCKQIIQVHYYLLYYFIFDYDFYFFFSSTSLQLVLISFKNTTSSFYPTFSITITKQYSLFSTHFYHASACAACRAQYCFTIFACLALRYTVIFVYIGLQMHISLKSFRRLVGYHPGFSEPHHLYKIPKGTPQWWHYICRRWEKFKIFYQNCHLYQTI